MGELIAEEDVCGEYPKDLRVSGVIADSREVLPGNVFVCISGCRKCGRDYIEEAVRRGAYAVAVEQDCKREIRGAALIRVKNSRSVYAKMLSRVYDIRNALKLIAVTGTNGKTTVCQMIKSAITESGRRCAVIGTLGACFEDNLRQIDRMTTPDPEVLYKLLFDYARQGAEYVVMEASSHALALGKLDGLTFEVGAITNMSAEHLDFHGNMEEYYKAKLKLFDKCKKGVFLCDDFYTVKMYGEAECERISCSVRDKERDYHTENIGFSFENGSVFTVVGDKGRSIPMHSPIPAEFTVSNGLLATAVLKALGIEEVSIYKGISRMKGVKGRMERVDTGLDFSVYIDFAHTPDALAKLLQGIRAIKRSESRVVTLFGCGGDRDKSKRSLMGMVASSLSDMVIVTSDNSRSEESAVIIDEIMKGIDKSRPHVRIDDRERAIEYAVMNAEKGDILLLCGKGHESYEIDKNGTRAFSERDIVLRCAANRQERMR